MSFSSDLCALVNLIATIHLNLVNEVIIPSGRWESHYRADYLKAMKNKLHFIVSYKSIKDNIVDLK